MNKANFITKRIKRLLTLSFSKWPKQSIDYLRKTNIKARKTSKKRILIGLRTNELRKPTNLLREPLSIFLYSEIQIFVIKPSGIIKLIDFSFL